MDTPGSRGFASALADASTDTALRAVLVAAYRPTRAAEQDLNHEEHRAVDDVARAWHVTRGWPVVAGGAADALGSAIDATRGPAYRAPALACARRRVVADKLVERVEHELEWTAAMAVHQMIYRNRGELPQGERDLIQDGVALERRLAELRCMDVETRVGIAQNLDRAARTDLEAWCRRRRTDADANPDTVDAIRASELRQIRRTRRMMGLVGGRTRIAAARRSTSRARHREPHRPRGRRAGASSSTSSADPGDGADSDPEGPPPPQLRLWRHPVHGACTPSLLRVLVGGRA